MKAKLTGEADHFAQFITGSFRNMTTGYRAVRIELQRTDVQTMIQMLQEEPEELLKHLCQLEGRFVRNE